MLKSGANIKFESFFLWFSPFWFRQVAVSSRSTSAKMPCRHKTTCTTSKRWVGWAADFGLNHFSIFPSSISQLGANGTGIRMGNKTNNNGKRTRTWWSSAICLMNRVVLSSPPVSTSPSRTDANFFSSSSRDGTGRDVTGKKNKKIEKGSKLARLFCLPSGIPEFLSPNPNPEGLATSSRRSRRIVCDCQKEEEEENLSPPSSLVGGVLDRSHPAQVSILFFSYN